MRDPLDDLGPLVAQRRESLGLSLRDASSQAGVPVATLARVEAGRAPDLTTFRRLVGWLGLPPDRFFRTTERTASTPDAISEHLRLDPALAPEDAAKIADLVRMMYETLQRQDRRRLAVHLRAAKTFTPPALHLLTDLLGDMQDALDAAVEPG